MGRRRGEFSRMTQKLKSTIMLKDKEFLQELIDSPNVMKRKLMSNLILERQAQISTQLTKLRMRPPASSSATNSSTSEDNNADNVIKELENDSKWVPTKYFVSSLA